MDVTLAHRLTTLAMIAVGFMVVSWLLRKGNAFLDRREIERERAEAREPRVVEDDIR